MPTVIKPEFFRMIEQSTFFSSKLQKSILTRNVLYSGLAYVRVYNLEKSSIETENVFQLHNL